MKSLIGGGEEKCEDYSEVPTWVTMWLKESSSDENTMYGSDYVEMFIVQTHGDVQLIAEYSGLANYVI